MKKFLKTLLLFVIGFTLAFAAFGCKNTGGTNSGTGGGTEAAGDGTQSGGGTQSGSGSGGGDLETPGGGTEQGGDETPAEEGESLLIDKKFTQGLGVLGLVAVGSDTQPGRYIDYGGTVTDPASKYKWNLGQWSGKSDLRLAKETALPDGSYNYTDGGKSVTFNPTTGVFNLSIDGSNEYDHPRTASEGWAHSLIEQSFPKKRLSDAEHLYFKLKFTLDYVENQMSIEEYNPGLHAAQLLWYVTFTNEPEENEYVDGEWTNGTPNAGFWFGVPIYDNRYDTIKASAAYDQGTHMYITGLSNSYYLPTPLQTGADEDGIPWTYSFKFDALPYINDAIAEAQKQGALTNVKAENLTIGYMNFGWEVPGTFNVSATIEDIDIIYVAKSE